jgi:hypothetical protein
MRGGDIAIMTYAVLLPIGAIRMYRKSKLKRLKATDFPNVTKESFETWKQFATKSINLFFLASWGTFIYAIVVSLIIPLFIRSLPMILPVLILPFLPFFFITLIISERYRIKAAKLRKQF